MQTPHQSTYWSPTIYSWAKPKDTITRKDGTLFVIFLQAGLLNLVGIYFNIGGKNVFYLFIMEAFFFSFVSQKHALLQMLAFYDNMHNLCVFQKRKEIKLDDYLISIDHVGHCLSVCCQACVLKHVLVPLSTVINNICIRSIINVTRATMKSKLRTST